MGIDGATSSSATSNQLAGRDDGLVPDDVAEVGWMLEELRVSLWAQQLQDASTDLRAAGREGSHRPLSRYADRLIARRNGYVVAMSDAMTDDAAT